MKRSVTPDQAKLIHMKGKFKKSSSAGQFTEAWIKARPGRRWARCMISFIHSPEPMVGCLARSACIRKMRIKYMPSECKKRFQKTAVKHGNNGIQQIRQVIGRMAIIMHCGLMKIILIG